MKPLLIIRAVFHWEFDFIRELQCDASLFNVLLYVVYSLRGSLQAAYNDRRALRDQQLQQETSVRDIQWRLHCKQKCLHRASQLTHTQPEVSLSFRQGTNVVKKHLI